MEQELFLLKQLAIFMCYFLCSLPKIGYFSPLLDEFNSIVQTRIYNVKKKTLHLLLFILTFSLLSAKLLGQETYQTADSNENEIVQKAETNLSLNDQVLEFNQSNPLFLKMGGVIIILILIIAALIYFNFKKVNKSKISTKLLTDQNAKLLDANTTREKFLSIIGHDLKNPFNSVLGLSNLLIDQWRSLEDEERFQISNEINSSSQSLFELLDNLLIWSRSQTSTTKQIPEKFDINESIQNIFEIYRNQAIFKNINVRMEISGVKNVYADPNMINTVIRNLLSNALKFTHSGGQIVIRTQNKPDMVEFSISDNGKGILPDDLKRIFDDSGHQTTRGTANETGSGLGLLLAKDFIRRNNGLIWVESKPGKGSLFTITLPVA